MQRARPVSRGHVLLGKMFIMNFLRELFFPQEGSFSVARTWRNRLDGGMRPMKKIALFSRGKNRFSRVDGGVEGGGL